MTPFYAQEAELEIGDCRMRLSLRTAQAGPVDAAFLHESLEGAVARASAAPSYLHWAAGMWLDPRHPATYRRYRIAMAQAALYLEMTGGEMLGPGLSASEAAGAV